MKKNLLLVVVCTLFVTSAYAQERGFGYGIKAGVNIAKVTNMGVDSKVGFTGGFFVDYRFSKVFALSADILYSGQGGDDTREKLKTDNLNIPILANLYLAKGLAFKTGLQPGFVMGAKIDDTPVTDGCNTVTFAVPVGLSYTFSCGLLFDVRYQIGLSNVFKEQDKYRNGVFSIMAGWRF